MKAKIQWFLTITMIFSVLLLGACATAEVVEPVAPEVDVVEPAEPTEEVVPEPEVEEPVEPEPVDTFTEADMDAAFAVFLADMEAYNTINLAALNEQLIEEPPFLLDVRSPEEAEASGHIEGSVLIPLRELGDNLAYLPSFDTPIVSYCGSGWRCTIALTALEALGWEDVKGLKGGSFGGWVDEGYAYVEGLEPEAEMLNAADPNDAFEALMAETLAGIPEGWGGITAEALNTELAENPDLILIDARRQDELDEKGVIDAENVIHIPLEEFIEMKDQWPADLDAPIVVYCGSGHRSTIAMTILWAYGYEDVRSLKGGFGDWAGAGYAVLGGPEPEADLDAAFATFLTDMEAYNTISLAALNEQLIEDPPFLLDVRSPEEAEASGHIEGSVLIPLRDLGANLAYLPSFDTPIVSYCGSGWRCTIALTALEAMGWEDVKGLKGGSFGGWVDEGYAFVEGLEPEADMLNAAEPDAEMVALFDEVLSGIPEGWGGITAEALNTELAENPDLILIDARRQDELDEKGVIDAENVIRIPLEQFIEMKDHWPADLDAPIVVYCGSGHRSTIAMTILWAYSYEDVRSLKGGFGDWAGAGYAVAPATP